MKRTLFVVLVLGVACFAGYAGGTTTKEPPRVVAPAQPPNTSQQYVVETKTSYTERVTRQWVAHSFAPFGAGGQMIPVSWRSISKTTTVTSVVQEIREDGVLVMTKALPLPSPATRTTGDSQMWSGSSPPSAVTTNVRTTTTIKIKYR